MEENSVNKSVVIFLLSICVISLCLGIYANYRLIVITRENKELKEKEKDKVYGVEEEETELIDEKVLDTIKRRQVVLKNYTSDDISSIKSRIYEKNQNSKDLLEEQKILAVLYTLFNNDKNYEELDRNKYPNIVSNSEASTLIIKMEDVNKLYTEVFGGKLDTNTKISNDSFYYNAEYDVYVINAGFGGACSDGSLTYDYKYTFDSANVYVYSTHAYYKNCPYELYKDFNMTDKYDTVEPIELGENNYQDFYKYRITYKKKGNNYTFAKIEQIK